MMLIFVSTDFSAEGQAERNSEHASRETEVAVRG